MSVNKLSYLWLPFVGATRRVALTLAILIQRVTLTFFLMFFYLVYPLPAANQNDWIAQSIDLTINTCFTEAESLLTQKIASGDSTAEVYFFLISVLNSKMTHFENKADEVVFYQAIEKVIELTDRNLSGNKSSDQMSNARQLFYRGSAYGYRAFYQGQTGNWLDALDNGMQSINDLEQAVALDSTLYDAYLGIGVYQYWRSTKLKYLYWMPFIEDQRRKGIENIRKAAHKSIHSRYMAMHQLIYILLNYGKKDEAVPYAQEIIKAYPKSTFMWWAYAHTWYMRHEYPKAIKAYEHLLSLLNELPGQNPNHIISCHARLAEIYFKINNSSECRRAANRTLKLAQRISLSKEGHKSVKKAQALLDDLTE